MPQRFEKASGDNRIVNGIDAPQGKYPSVVSLQGKSPWSSSWHMCGGTILNENWVLTSAKCLRRCGVKRSDF
jgi:secreted trypsin-like serine protease